MVVGGGGGGGSLFGLVAYFIVIDLMGAQLEKG